jgi:hypothetical protein
VGGHGRVIGFALGLLLGLLLELQNGLLLGRGLLIGRFGLLPATRKETTYLVANNFLLRKAAVVVGIGVLGRRRGALQGLSHVLGRNLPALVNLTVNREPGSNRKAKPFIGLVDHLDRLPAHFHLASLQLTRLRVCSSTRLQLLMLLLQFALLSSSLQLSLFLLILQKA